MNHILTTEIIQKFIKLGQAYSENDPSLNSILSNVKSHAEVNRLHWSDWDQYTEKMSTSDLISLIKGPHYSRKKIQMDRRISRSSYMGL